MDRLITHIRRFWRDEIAQDLIEYTLLLSFVALGVVAVFIGVGKSAQGPWITANSTLTTANGGAGTVATRPRGDGDGGNGDGGH